MNKSYMVGNKYLKSSLPPVNYIEDIKNETVEKKAAVEESEPWKSVIYKEDTEIIDGEEENIKGQEENVAAEDLEP